MQIYFYLIVIILGLTFSSCKEQRESLGATETEAVTQGSNVSEMVTDFDSVLERLTKRFDLTPEQQNRIKEMHAEFDFASLSEENFKGRFQEFRELVTKNVLTDAQRNGLKD